MTSPPNKSATFARWPARLFPASTVYDVPGADDEQDIRRHPSSLERDRDDVRRALAHLAAIGGCAFADLEAERRAEVAEAFREVGGAPLAALVRVVLLCYYRDDRVMRSLGQEAAPAFSQGACRRAGRLVAARSGPRAAADVSHGGIVDDTLFSPPSTRPCAWWGGVGGGGRLR